MRDVLWLLKKKILILAKPFQNPPRHAAWEYDLRDKLSKYVHFCARIIFGGIFIYSGLEKLFYPDEFSQAINNYYLFPVFLIKIITIFLPLIELNLGFLLIFKLFVRESALILSSLLIGFMFVVGIKALNGPIDDCGCFSPSSPLSTTNIYMLMLRDFSFLGLGIITIRSTGKNNLLKMTKNNFSQKKCT